MDNDNVASVLYDGYFNNYFTFDPVVGAFGYFEKVGERRAMMVGPVILSHTPTKVLVFVVRRPL